MTTETLAPPARLCALLSQDPISLDEVAAFLDALPSADRIAAARAVPGALQARLWEAAAKNPPLGIEDIVPADVPPMRPVRHYGRNSLPAFKYFEKRFCRPEGERGKERLFGYNHQKMAWATGPGCMVAYAKDGEVWIDYREIPDQVPQGWPAPRANDRGLSKLVYGNVVDHLRRVSRHVTIGRAFRPDVPEANYFILCREE